MSCIQLSAAHIAAVAHGLAFILNGSGGMCQLAAVPELRDALNPCRYPHGFLFDDRRIFVTLYELNKTAYNERYKVGLGDELPAIPQTFPHLLHPLELDSNNERYIIDSDFYKFIKLLDSLIYQCNDGQRNLDSYLLQALHDTSRSLCAFIVEQSSSYDNADWMI